MTVEGRRFAYTIILAALVLAALACNLPRRSTQQPADATPVPVSTQSLATLQSDLEAAATQVQAGQNQPVTIEFTEEQLTTLLAVELEKSGDDRIQNPQILLRDGQIQVLGDINQSGLSLPLKVAITPSVDAEGKPHYQIVQASLGPMPLPDSMMEELSSRLDQALGAKVMPQTENVAIENITIRDGVMTVTGHTR